jgi:hypothetical protein
MRGCIHRSGLNGSTTLTFTRALAVNSDPLEPEIDLVRGNDVLFAYMADTLSVGADPFALR